VGGAGIDLLPNVREEHLDRHHEEAPAVHGRNRTVPAQMLAAAAGLHVADELEPVVSFQMRVLLQRR
jgi:hypothetical protein